MINVEVLSNNKLTVRNDALAKAVSDSIKHETVKFSFADNWKDYLKTAVFSTDEVDAINVALNRENMMCITEDECYIPHEVLKGRGFYLSVYGVMGDRLATTTKIKIEVLESGYALGDEPEEPTPSQYSQILEMVNETKDIAEKLRQDAQNGLFNGEKGAQGEQGIQGAQGEKGEKGDKGDKGDPYTLTEEDKNEIVLKVKEDTVGGVSSWNDLTDKPFYDEGRKTAILDYANLPQINVNAAELVFYKVTNDVLNESNLTGSTVSAMLINASGEQIADTLTINGFTGKQQFGFGTLFVDVIANTVLFYIVAVTKTGRFEVDGTTIEITETGTYFALIPEGYEIPKTMAVEYDYTKPLDIKFIPNELYNEVDKRIENYINEALGGEY